jgi:hypothetical protein
LQVLVRDTENGELVVEFLVPGKEELFEGFAFAGGAVLAD